MPLQIKELHIKVTVNADGEKEAVGENTSATTSPDQGMDKKELIAECVEQVLDILREKREP